MIKHEPDEDGRCRATDLLPRDCAGCRGSDTRFVDLLLASDPEPAVDFGETEPLERPGHLNPLDGQPLGRGRKWWLDTGPSGEVIADSHAFKSSYTGSMCKACRHSIRSGQMIVHTNVGGYAHVKCLKGDS